MKAVRQKMRTSADEHVSESRVIIDDVLLHSTSLSLRFLLFVCYTRVYFKNRESFKLVNVTSYRSSLNLLVVALFLRVILLLPQNTT